MRLGQLDYNLARARGGDDEHDCDRSLLAYISIIVAAVARLPGLITFGPLAFFGVTFIFVLIGMIYDYVTRGRVHPVYVWGGTIFAVSVPLRLMIAETAAWQAFAEFVVR